MVILHVNNHGYIFFERRINLEKPVIGLVRWLGRGLLGIGEEKAPLVATQHAMEFATL